MMRGKNIQNCKKTKTKTEKIAKNAKNCQIAKMQKIAIFLKFAIFLKIAINRCRDFPEGQVPSSIGFKSFKRVFMKLRLSMRFLKPT